MTAGEVVACCSCANGASFFLPELVGDAPVGTALARAGRRVLCETGGCLGTR